MENVFERRPWLVPVALAVLTVVLFKGVLFPLEAGQVLDGKDLPAMFYPLQEYIRQSLQAGDLPLWNPRQFIGYPIIGNPHAALFYPASWFVWLIGVQRGIGLMLVFHSWLGAWGMERFARGFGASRTGSLLAGVVFAMSGRAGGHYYAGHYNLLMVMAWIPWALAASHFALKRRTWWAVLPGDGGRPAGRYRTR